MSDIYEKVRERLDMFHIEINKNDSERILTLSGSNLGLLCKLFPLLIMMVLQKIYLEIYNLLRSLVVSSIILMIVKSGMEVAPLLMGDG